MAEPFLGTKVWVTDPDTPVDFGKCFSLKWGATGGNVVDWTVCVGTKKGDWDIFVAQTGKRTQIAVDVSDLPKKVAVLYVQLVYRVADAGKEDADGQPYISEIFEIKKA